jgi:hypothetical protein
MKEKVYLTTPARSETRRNELSSGVRSQGTEPQGTRNPDTPSQMWWRTLIHHCIISIMMHSLIL